MVLLASAGRAHADDPPSATPPEVEPAPAPLIGDGNTAPAGPVGTPSPENTGPKAAAAAPVPPANATPGDPKESPAAAGLASAPAAGPTKDSVPIQNIESLDLKDLLNEPVVTAGGGVEEERSLASANVYTISREEIAAHGWRSLGELLAVVPSLYVIDDLVLPSIGVRGVTGGVKAGTRLVKVMINGQSVNFRPELTSFLGPEFIPIEAVERVEIAKGPLSALYGANAFIATVNVITRDPNPALHTEVAARSTIYGKAGFGGSGVVSYGDANRGFLLALTVDQIARSGLTLERTFPGQPTNPDLFSRESANDYANPFSAFGRFYIGTNAIGRFSLSVGYQRLDSGGEFQLNSILTHQTRISLENTWLQLRYDKSWSKVALAVTSGYSQGAPTRDYRLDLTGNNISFFRPNYGYQSGDGKVEVTYTPFSERLSLRGGLDFEYTREQVLYYTQTLEQAQGPRQPGDTLALIAPMDAREVGYYDIGAFLQATSTPIARLSGLRLTGNLRLDKIAFGPVDFPLQFSWRIAAAYRINTNWTARFFGGQAFQTPSGVMLFAHPGFGSANNVIGNLTVDGLPPLSPQNVTSAEGLISGRIFNYLTLELAFYYRVLQNKIEFTRQGLDFVATNAGIQHSIGFESVLRFSYRWFSAYGNASVDGPFKDDKFDPQAGPLYPRGIGTLGIDAHLAKIYLHANTQVRIVGPRGASQSNIYLNNDKYYELPTYAVWDLTLSSTGLRLFGNESETRILLSARNLLGQTSADPGVGGIDLPRLGRSFLIELRQIF
jgi:outer membrane receptor protein involved in Fe transport